MVSDSIEIESLKYNDFLDTAKPIHYILNLKDKFTEQRKGTKNTFGTKITLKLRPDYINKLENKSIVNIINDNMSFQEIPISVNSNDEISILDTSGIIIPEDYESIRNVLVYKIEGYDWIEGFIAIYHGQHQGVISRGNLSQQCFTISNNTLDLIPSWINFGSAFIDIRPPKKLQLKASRNKVQNDDTYNDLKNFVTEFIISKFETEININVLESYIDGKSLALGKNKKEYDFLIENIIFYSIDNKIRFNKILYRNIIHKQKNNKIAIVHLDFTINENILSRWNFMFTKYDTVLAYTNSIYFLYGFIQPYVDKIKIITTNISGLVYIEISTDNKLSINFNDFIMGNSRYTGKNARTYYTDDNKEIIYKNKSDNIFCVIGNMQYNSIEIHINYNHKLGKLLDRLSNTTLVKRFIGSFISNISNAVINGNKLDNYINYDGEYHFNVDNNIAYSLRSIRFMSTKFIDTLNKSLLDDVLLPLKSSGHIEENPVEFLLTKNDFPEWWFND